MVLNCSVGEDSWESLGLQGDPTSPSYRKSALNIYWKDWCWSWRSNTLATWCTAPIHWKSPWCWERLKMGEGDDREWDGWMASLTWWTWVWGRSGSWWWTGKPGVLQPMGSQGFGHNWVTELNYKYNIICYMNRLLRISIITGYDYLSVAIWPSDKTKAEVIWWNFRKSPWKECSYLFLLVNFYFIVVLACSSSLIIRTTLLVWDYVLF